MANFLLVVVAWVFLCSVSLTEATDFNLDWVENPEKGYNDWAESMRYQVHDRIIFRYPKGEDSVLLVTKEDYDNCYLENPIQTFEDGNTAFTFDHSGPFYFLSGSDCSCNKGRMLIVVVMAERNGPSSPRSGDVNSPSSTSTQTGDSAGISDDASVRGGAASAPPPGKSDSELTSVSRMCFVVTSLFLVAVALS